MAAEEGEGSQVVCLAAKAKSGSNVHLFRQTETTGHSGAGAFAEIRVKLEVEESSGMHGECSLRNSRHELFDVLSEAARRDHIFCLQIKKILTETVLYLHGVFHF